MTLKMYSRANHNDRVVSMQPLIGITVGEITNKNESWSPITYGQSRTYIDAIIHAGGTPVILPLTDDKKILKDLFNRCDGVLVAGGNDPDPKLYDDEPISEVTDVSRRRDDQEIQLIKWALDEDKPMLGICRGMQILNIERGGTLYQDIPTQLPKALNHRISSERKTTTDIAHNLKIKPNSKLEAIIEAQKIGANAHHHQAIHELGEGLVATAWAEDGIIEAVELPNKKFIIGVQSHPESLEGTTEKRWSKLFKAFVESTKIN